MVNNRISQIVKTCKGTIRGRPLSIRIGVVESNVFFTVEDRVPVYLDSQQRLDLMHGLLKAHRLALGIE